MPRTPGPAEPLYSTLAQDPDLGEIVELFVEEMPNRVSTILDRLKASDWEGLRQVVHQLRGAAGSHGFGPITDSAARGEEAVGESRPEDEIRRSVQALVELCGRARAGVPV